jgi:arabinan endo-1,5-alpha-L-arabinosidase
MLLLAFIFSVSLSIANYSNPIVPKCLPDPTCLRITTGEYYLYATEEETRNVPIYKSRDLVKWEFVDTAFTNQTRPDFISGGVIWAPDINLINEKYVMYFAMAIPSSTVDKSGVGVAYADKPEGPFTFGSKFFDSVEVGVGESIDPVYIEDQGKKYFVWGSFYGIYAFELEDDGLHIKSGSEKVEIAGDQFEGTYIHKRGDYFYFFGSVGFCCSGVDSTYQVAVGRSKSVLGPYVDKRGRNLLNGGFTVILTGNDRFRGPGHNSKLVQDGAGNDWMLYHAYDAKNERAGRLLMIDRVLWDEDDWPYIEGGSPSLTATEPVFR